VSRCGTEVDTPAAELDEHQDVERPEPGGLDGEEIAGHDPARLSPQELAPGRSGPSWGRTEPGGPEQEADRRRSDADPELAKLVLDPHAAPAGVLPGHPEDERTDVGINRWPAWATGPAVGPLPAHEFAMPPEEGPRGHEEGDPAVTREYPTDRREQDSVARTQPGPARRPLQHPELMAEDEDLEVLRLLVTVTEISDDDQANENPDDTVEERPHRPMVLSGSERESGFPTPHRRLTLATCPEVDTARANVTWGNWARAVPDHSFGSPPGRAPAASCGIVGAEHPEAGDVHVDPNHLRHRTPGRTV
jgi:hypothetical protein